MQSKMHYSNESISNIHSLHFELHTFNIFISELVL